jgi:dTDP-4-dehydrorhamnose reductase
MNKILIIGSNGLLGSSLTIFLRKKNDVVVFNRKKNNLTNFSSCLSFLTKNYFDVIINLSAVTDIDFSEKNKNFTKRINFLIVKNICKSIKELKLKIFLIQLSTDQFYYNFSKNFENIQSYKNYYSKTKLLAEKECLEINSSILRTNFFGKSLANNRKSFTDWIYKNLSNNKKIFMAEDILFNPVSIETLCGIIQMIVKKKIKGVFNIGSKNGFSKYLFSLKFAKYAKLNPMFIVKTTMSKINFFAKRNKDMRMQTVKFENKYNYKFNTLNNEIKKVAVYYKTR